jgi:hypothetical protein
VPLGYPAQQKKVAVTLYFSRSPGSCRVVFDFDGYEPRLQQVYAGEGMDLEVLLTSMEEAFFMFCL